MSEEMTDKRDPENTHTHASQGHHHIPGLSEPQLAVVRQPPAALCPSNPTFRPAFMASD